MNPLQIGLRYVLFALLLLALSGCYEVMPQRVEESITIERDGRFQLSYAGTFKDFSTLIENTGKAEDMQDIALKKLKAAPSAKVVKQTAPHTFFVRFEESGSFEHDDLTPFLGGASSVSKVAPSFLELKPIRELELGFEAKDGLTREDRAGLDSMVSGTNPEAHAAKALLNGLHATLTIRIDAALVGEHNAQSVKKDRDGKTAYTWHIDRRSLNPVKFAFFFGKQDLSMFKLLRSPPGSECQKVIGQECKCGPFVLYKSRGAPMANSGYQMNTDAGPVRGCTDAGGVTQTISVKLTGGPCSVSLLSPEESTKLCPVPETR